MGLIKQINQYYDELCYGVAGGTLGVLSAAFAGVKFYHASTATNDVVVNGNIGIGIGATLLAIGSGIFAYNKAIKPMLGKAPQEEKYGLTLLDALNDSKRNRDAYRKTHRKPDVIRTVQRNAIPKTLDTYVA
jgi:hypothetical protein